MTTIHTFEQDEATNDLNGVDILPVMIGEIGARENGFIQFANLIIAVVRELLYYSYWMSPGLLNSWANYEGFSEANYYRDCLDVVHLTGVVEGGVVGQPIFILAEHFRPVNDKIFLVADSTGFGEIRISAATGEVVLVTGGNDYVSLEGITFRKGYEGP